jgi:hypothetical protein
MEEASGSSSGLQSPDQATATSTQEKFSLENILGDNHEILEHPGLNNATAQGWDEDALETTAVEGYCVECEGASNCYC